MSNKPTYIIIPGESVGPIKIGMTHEEVLVGMNEIGQTPRNTYEDYFHGAALHVHYDLNDKVDEIQLANDLNISITREEIESNAYNEFVLELMGKNPFTMRAVDFIDFISKTTRRSAVEYMGNTNWPQLGLGIWRQGTEKDIPEGEEYFECKYIGSIIVRKKK